MAQVLYFDIEHAPTRGWVWRNYESNLIETDKDWYLLSFAYKWAHEKKVHTVALPDFEGYDKDKECDKHLAIELWKLFDAADVLIAHNGDKFDIRKANARFLTHGLRPPSPAKSIDTLKLARRHFAFSSNRLDDLGNYLGCGRKLAHTGKHLWFSCMAGDPKAFALLRRYNAQDVRLLERVYEKLKPWDQKHPNLTAWGEGVGCPVCESTNFQRRGVMVKVSAKRQRLHCQDCGHWFSGKLDVAN
jgi:hypothetical protein